MTELWLPGPNAEERIDKALNPAALHKAHLNARDLTFNDIKLSDDESSFLARRMTHLVLKILVEYGPHALRSYAEGEQNILGPFGNTLTCQ